MNILSVLSGLNILILVGVYILVTLVHRLVYLLAKRASRDTGSIFYVVCWSIYMILIIVEIGLGLVMFKNYVTTFSRPFSDLNQQLWMGLTGISFWIVIYYFSSHIILCKPWK